MRGYNANPYYCLEGSTSPIRYSLPGWFVDECSISEGILSFVEYAPRLRIVLPSRQKRMECASHFFSPSGDILNYILSSWCLPVGWCDCLLGALKAHEETSAHDYQGWLQARPIREDIKKYFYLLINWMNESIKPKGSEYDKVFWSYFSLPSCLLCDSLVIPM